MLRSNESLWPALVGFLALVLTASALGQTNEELKALHEHYISLCKSAETPAEARIWLEEAKRISLRITAGDPDQQPIRSESPTTPWSNQYWDSTYRHFAELLAARLAIAELNCVKTSGPFPSTRKQHDQALAGYFRERTDDVFKSYGFDLKQLSLSAPEHINYIISQIDADLRGLQPQVRKAVDEYLTESQEDFETPIDEWEYLDLYQAEIEHRIIRAFAAGQTTEGKIDQPVDPKSTLLVGPIRTPETGFAVQLTEDQRLAIEDQFAKILGETARRSDAVDMALDRRVIQLREMVEVLESYLITQSLRSVLEGVQEGKIPDSNEVIRNQTLERVLSQLEISPLEEQEKEIGLRKAIDQYVREATGGQGLAEAVKSGAIDELISILRAEEAKQAEHYDDLKTELITNLQNLILYERDPRPTDWEILHEMETLSLLLLTGPVADLSHEDSVTIELRLGQIAGILSKREKESAETLRRIKQDRIDGSHPAINGLAGITGFIRGAVFDFIFDIIESIFLLPKLADVIQEKGLLYVASACAQATIEQISGLDEWRDEALRYENTVDPLTVHETWRDIGKSMRALKEALRAAAGAASLAKATPATLRQMAWKAKNAARAARKTAEKALAQAKKSGQRVADEVLDVIQNSKEISRLAENLQDIAKQMEKARAAVARAVKSPIQSARSWFAREALTHARRADELPILGAFNVAEGVAHATSTFKKGPWTHAGRALTKHPNIVGVHADPSSVTKALTAEFGSTRGVNEAAAAALDNIVESGRASAKIHKAYGPVVDYKLPNQLGARFDATSNRFIGFLGRDVR